MSHSVKSVVVVVLLAVVLAACGSATDSDSSRTIPTMAQNTSRAVPTIVAAIPTERALPTLRPTSLPDTGASTNNERPSIPGGNDPVPDAAATEEPQPLNALPFTVTNPNTNTGAPPFGGGSDTQSSSPFDNPNTDAAATEEAGPVASVPPVREKGDGEGGSVAPPFGDNNDSSSPFGDSTDSDDNADSGNNLPFNIDTNTNSPFGGGDSSSTGPPFGNTNSNSGGSPFGGGGDSSSNNGPPFGNTNSGGTPFGGGTPFATVGGSRWFINGEQPVSVLACPEPTCEIIGGLEAGDSVELAAEANAADGEEAADIEVSATEWIAIQYSGDVAYIFGAFISEREQTQSTGGPGSSGLPFDPSGGSPNTGGLPFSPGGGGNPGSGLPFDPSSGPPGSGGVPPFLTGGNPGTTTPRNGMVESGGTFPSRSGFDNSGVNPLFNAPEVPQPSGPGGPGGPGGPTNCPPFLPNC